MKIINLTQGTPEWLAWRKNGIGSSDIAAICGVCPYRTRTDVMKEKLGFGENFVNAAMERGKYYEEEARQLYNFEFSTNHQPICIEHHKYSYFIASLDGYNPVNHSILEIKVPGKKNWELAQKKSIPENYMYQIQWQMLVALSGEAYYMVYSPENKLYKVIPVFIDKHIQKHCTEESHKFYADFQEGRYEAPEKPIVQKICSSFDSHLRSMHNLKENIKLNQERYEQLQKELIEIYGQDHTLMGTDYSLTRSERVNTDYKAAAEKYCPDLSAFKKTPSISWTLRKNKE